MCSNYSGVRTNQTSRVAEQAQHQSCLSRDTSFIQARDVSMMRNMDGWG